LSNISFVNQAEIPFPSGSGQPKFSAVHLSSWAPTVVVVVVALPATVVVVVVATSATVVVVISSSGIVVVVVTSATLVVVIVVDVVDVDRKPDDVDVGSATVVVVVVALPATVVVVVIATSATVVVVISSSGIVVVVVTSATLVVVIVVDVVDVDKKPDDVDVGSGVGGVPHWQNSGGQKGTALLQLAVHHWSVA